jgi:hypothetical protein
MRSRIDWKYLLGWELEDPGFDFSILRGCPETSQPRYAAFKPLADDIGKQNRIAVKACSA